MVCPLQDKMITNGTLYRFCDLKEADLDLVFGEVVSQVRHIHSKSQRHINDEKIQEKNTFNSDNVENLDSDL